MGYSICRDIESFSLSPCVPLTKSAWGLGMSRYPISESSMMSKAGTPHNILIYFFKSDS
jgi:hypothetical protein